MELLYLPEIINTIGPQKVYFLFKSETYSETDNSQKVIVTNDKNILNKYQTLEDLRQYQNVMDDFNDNKKIIFISDEYQLTKFSSRKFERATKLYKYLQKNENKYKSLSKFRRLFPIDRETLFYSNIFIYFLKHMFFYKIKFNLVCLMYIILGLLKFLIYPFIFIFDILRSTFESYKNYKVLESKYKYFITGSMKMKMAYMGYGEAEFKKQKNESQKKLNNAKDNYINRNITVITLSIAILGVFFAWYKDLSDKKNHNDIVNKYILQINDLTTQNSLMTTQINKQKDYIYENTILNNLLNSKDIEILKLNARIKELEEKKILQEESKKNELLKKK